MDEFKSFVGKLQVNKATGVYNIPNFVLKNPDILHILHQLFSKLFESCILPSVWLKSVINPIPKGSNKDPYIPLNYRRISLLSCVGKVFSGIINHCIVDYCESNNIYEDEQNGFRRKRSCKDHIYTLTSIIRNRLSHNQSTYCCFIDMPKTFD